MKYSPWGRKELDTTERLSTARHKEFCFYLYFVFFIFWRATRLVGPQFPDQGSNLGHGSDNTAF